MLHDPLEGGRDHHWASDDKFEQKFLYYWYDNMIAKPKVPMIVD